MKKLVMTVAVLAFAVTIVSAQTVSSANIVGYYKTLKIADGLQTVGVSFADTTLEEFIDIGQFQGATSFADADQVYIWDPATQIYAIYGKFDGSAFGQPIAWRLSSAWFGDNQNPVLTAGSSVFVNSVKTLVDSDMIGSGEVPLGEYSTNSLVIGLQMVALPYSATVDLNATGLTNGVGSTTFADADKVYIWNDVGQTYDIYGYFDGFAVAQPVEWRKSSAWFSAASAIPLDLGKGFWYNAGSVSEWIERNPYFDNL